MEKTTKESSRTAGKPIRCRAAVARKAGKPLVIEEVMVAPPKSGEVRIKIICTSLCHSDVTFLNLEDPPACFPRILGHEAVGVVESIGEGVSELVEVILSSQYFCQTVQNVLTAHQRRAIYVRNSPLSFIEYTVLNVANVTKVDPAIPPNRACLLSCGVSTGVGAAWRSAKVEAGSTVAIFGLGTIGLAVAEGARLCGAVKIIGVDVNPQKSELAKRFGVTDFVDSRSCGDKPVSQIINEMTSGGADYCFECVGMASLVEEAYACSRKGWGKTIVLGVDKPGAQLRFSSLDFLQQGKTLKGSIFGGLNPKSDIPILVKRYMDKELELDKFVTDEVCFEDINEAFDLLHEGKSLRCIIRMEK